MTFTRVSVDADTAEPDHFFSCFRRLSDAGNKCFRKRICVLQVAETQENAPETDVCHVSITSLRVGNISFFLVQGFPQA